MAQSNIIKGVWMNFFSDWKKDDVKIDYFLMGFIVISLVFVYILI